MDDRIDYRRLVREFDRMGEEEIDGSLKAGALQMLLELSDRDEALVLGFMYGLTAAKHMAAKNRIRQEDDERMRRACEEGLRKAQERCGKYMKDIQQGPKQDGETPEAERNDE